MINNKLQTEVEEKQEETKRKTKEKQIESKEKPQVRKLQKPSPRMCIDEFLINSDLRAEHKAGFRVFAGKTYNSEKEWKAKLEEYKSRKYEGGVTK